MRALTQTELSRMTRFELMALLQRIAAELPDHPEGSHELRIAQYTCASGRRWWGRNSGLSSRC